MIYSIAQVSTNGSSSTYVWETSDVVDWFTDKLVDVMLKSAFNPGKVVWDAATNSYAVFWASHIYAQSDTGRSGIAGADMIYYAHTTEFRTYTKPQIWLVPGYSVIDQEILPLGGSSVLHQICCRKQSVLGASRLRPLNAHLRQRLRRRRRARGFARLPRYQRGVQEWLWLDNDSGSRSYEAYYNDDPTQNVWTQSTPADAVWNATWRYSAGST